MYTITANRQVKLSHWYEIPKGGTITFNYRDSWFSKEDWASDWEFELSENVRPMWERSTYGVYPSNLMGEELDHVRDLMEMDNPSFLDYFNTLKMFLENDWIEDGMEYVGNKKALQSYVDGMKSDHELCKTDDFADELKQAILYFEKELQCT